MTKNFPAFWRKITPISIALLPFSIIFFIISVLRRKFITPKELSRKAKIIIIGNISVGGNGKTPSLIALAEALEKRNYRVGIISRGYGGNNQSIMEVFADSNPEICGDEALLIARKLSPLHIPVAIARKRVQAANYLLEKYQELEIIISDDGLQHYHLPRDFELVLLAPDLILGNKLLLPAGPLRECSKRLNSVNAIGVFAESELASKTPQFLLSSICDGFFALNTNEYYSLDKIKTLLTNRSSIAISSIARPERFFASLEQLGIKLEKQISFADHSNLSQANIIEQIEKQIEFADFVFITEKDAVKTQNWKQDWKAKTFVLQYRVNLPEELLQKILQTIAN